MFIGHFAPALLAATRKDAPRLPLLFFAAQLVDWVFFTLLLFGAENMRFSGGVSVMNPMDLYHMPYTHSLLGACVWSLALYGFMFWATRNKRAASLAGLVVLSHWFLDLLVHVPDLTLAGRPPKLGLGLWNHPMIEIPLELALTFGALWLYARVRQPKMVPLLLLAGTMLALQLFNWFGPVDSEVTTATSLLAFVAFGVITAAAWWAARSEAQH
jgi:hypothetical protein